VLPEAIFQHACKGKKNTIKLYDHPYNYLKSVFLQKHMVMTLIDFLSEFPDESSCKAKFKAFRDQAGVVCPSAAAS
jgi:hypothetical protein